MNIWDMRRTYVNIRRLRQILTVLAMHGFSHFLERMRISEHIPLVGRLLKKGDVAEAEKDLPTRLADAFQELGPVFVKLGQILASRPDLVPPDFVTAFTRLQDKVPPLPGETIVPVIETSLGRRIGDVFAEFNPDASAGGSIGQVHEALLLDGTAVIVKVKRVGVEKTVEEDLSLLEALAELVENRIPELAVVRPTMLARELRRAVTQELDYVGEAARATKFRESMREVPNVVIPKMHWEHITRDVLVMERIIGMPVSEAGRLTADARRRVAETVADCFMHQYFESGLFHADPHQGNIFFLPDGSIGLIDFGQTGRLSDDLRRALGRMLMALANGNLDLIADLYAEVGEFSPDANISGFRTDLASLVDRYYGMPADRVDFSQLAQEALSVARQNGLYLPRDFVLLVKSLMLVAGVIRELDPGFRLDRAIAPRVKRLWLGMFRPDDLLRRGMTLGARLSGILRRMPDDLLDIMEKAKAGRFTIVFHHENLDAATERAGRALDRLSLGILTAAVIIGSTIVLVSGDRGVTSEYTITFLGGLPVYVLLAGAGFLSALFLTAVMAWGIFRDKR